MSEQPKSDCKCYPATHFDGVCCDALSPEKRYRCTRESGHDGDHIACAGLCERYATWSSDNDAELEVTA